jgi:hypothetical protein
MNKNSLVPVENFDQLMKFAELAAKSDLVPKDYKEKPSNILIAWEMGAELGLSRMQALQSIAVINGRPSVWGDAIQALAQGNPNYEWHKEYYDEEKDAAVCIVKRRNAPEHRYEFSMKDVVTGGYDKKQGPWQNERRRMMQMRARRAFRDQFSDSLKGIYIAEEAQDIQPETTVTVVDHIPANQIDSIKSKIATKPKETITASTQGVSRNLTKPEWDYIQACLDYVDIPKAALFNDFSVKGGSLLTLSQMDEISRWLSLEVDKRNASDDNASPI